MVNYRYAKNIDQPFIGAGIGSLTCDELCPERTYIVLLQELRCRVFFTDRPEGCRGRKEHIDLMF